MQSDKYDDLSSFTSLVKQNNILSDSIIHSLLTRTNEKKQRERKEWMERTLTTCARIYLVYEGRKKTMNICGNVHVTVQRSQDEYSKIESRRYM